MSIKAHSCNTKPWNSKARKRKKEGKPAYFGAYVKRTRFKKTGLVRCKKGNRPIQLHHREALNIKLGKLRVSQDRSS